MFTKDHHNYARCLPIFICDLETLDEEHPSILLEFQNRLGFTIRKSVRDFSNIATDQAHEQNNKKIKTDGGAIGLFDAEAALLQWGVAGPELVKLIDRLGINSEDADELSDQHINEEVTHHEPNKLFEKKHHSRFRQLRSALGDLNPFVDGPSDQLMNITSRVLTDKSSSDKVMTAESLGKK